MIHETASHIKMKVVSNNKKTNLFVTLKVNGCFESLRIITVKGGLSILNTLKPCEKTSGLRIKLSKVSARRLFSCP